MDENRLAKFVFLNDQEGKYISRTTSHEMSTEADKQGLLLVAKEEEDIWGYQKWQFYVCTKN